MALSVFLFGGVCVILFGLGFVWLTLRHHKQVERAAREKKRLEERA